MKLLSPKKYIETKARSLPVYKCFVNKDWRQGKMSDVIVMRKHANGNITAGMFLVDLLCLGVKDTNFLFNEREEDILNRLKPILEFCEQIDYDTAHNIVYAGHDFALEYDIKPHKDFAITKYILEPDDDRIPLIEIPTGADDGKPYLLADKPGQYADALLKLKKNAGEGNYYYSAGIDGEDVDDDTKEDADEEFSEMLDDYDEEDVTPLAVQYIRNEDLEDAAKVESRSPVEQLTIRTELFYRVLKSLEPGYFYEEDVQERAEADYLVQAFRSTSVHSAENQAFMNASGELKEYFKRANSDIHSKDFIENLVHKYQESAYVTSNLYHLFIDQKNQELIALIAPYLEKLAATKLLANLSLALGALIMELDEPRFELMYHEADIRKAFPETETFDPIELGTFWLIQTYVHTEKEDLKNGFHYYELFAETRMHSWLLPFVQIKLCQKFKTVAEKKLHKRQMDIQGINVVQEENS